MTEQDRLRQQNDLLIRRLQEMDMLIHEFELALMHAGVKPSTIQKLKDKAANKSRV